MLVAFFSFFSTHGICGADISPYLKTYKKLSTEAKKDIKKSNEYIKTAFKNYKKECTKIQPTSSDFFENHKKKYEATVKEVTAYYTKLNLEISKKLDEMKKEENRLKEIDEDKVGGFLAKAKIVLGMPADIDILVYITKKKTIKPN